MADNTLEKLNSALDKLSDTLDTEAVKTALGLIPDTLKSPIIEGLKQVLEVVKTTLNDLKDKVASIVNLEDLFSTTTELLEAAEGLAPDQSSTFNEVRSVVQTLQDVPEAQQEIENILTKIDAIVTKLEAL
ncbi:hypothetical protein PN498_14035 [Oscillatoria sp. CS-180]|uniref:hypothetical protein n=1 Tax=Oscillatoria sp. CS-180 TaxID=3021720 RepID=UPI00232AFBA8|nr:hypothetical protein [Oscillatoria sp. CS-180]MDB9527117.1 hypothetical protein [Oscillatoria sp. CS-180]